MPRFELRLILHCSPLLFFSLFAFFVQVKRGKKVTEDHDDDDSEDEEEHKTTLREEVEREYYPEKYHFWPFGDPFMYKVRTYKQQPVDIFYQVQVLSPLPYTYMYPNAIYFLLSFHLPAQTFCPETCQRGKTKGRRRVVDTSLRRYGLMKTDNQGHVCLKWTTAMKRLIDYESMPCCGSLILCVSKIDYDLKLW